MGMFSKSRPSTELSNQEKAMQRRNKSLLDEEIEESEKRLKAQTRGRLGYASLLQGKKAATPTANRPSLVNATKGPTGNNGLGGTRGAS